MGPGLLFAVLAQLYWMDRDFRGHFPPCLSGVAMSCRCLLPASLAAVLLLGGTAGAQDDAKGPAGSADLTAGTTRKMDVAGAMWTIAANVEKTETHSDHDLVDVLNKDQKYGERPGSLNQAKDRRYQHNVWGLEFTFKPVRFVTVDLPAPDGKLDKKIIWYLLYHVRNTTSQEPVRFVPKFLLHSWDTDKYYPDRIIPLAVDEIRVAERVRDELQNTASLPALEISHSDDPQDNRVWGVATWEDVDPNTDRFSIYVQGLTNAYRWSDQDVRASGKARYFRKTLQLNFYRPSDDRHENEKEIRYGIPGEVDSRWLYK